MQMPMHIHLFRRDLRVDDNLALMEGLKKVADAADTGAGAAFVPMFIFNPVQADHSKNKYFSGNGLRFMIECLEELDKQLRRAFNTPLVVAYGQESAILKDVILHGKKSGHGEELTVISTNTDCTPFAVSRDKKLKEWCEKQNVELVTEWDYNLVAPVDKRALTLKGTPYKVFTPFYNNVSKIGVQKPKSLHQNQNRVKAGFPENKGYTWIKSLDQMKKKLLPKSITHTLSARPGVSGIDGRRVASDAASNRTTIGSYKDKRDMVDVNGTTRLSAYLKFGTISIREAYWMISTSGSATADRAPLIRQLYWREFYLHIAWHFPHVLRNQVTQQQNASLNTRYDSCAPISEHWVSANSNEFKKRFDAWKNGGTGVPMVDAGMRELKETGLMHNRARMITASFLVKDLHIHWVHGERYFATALIDYDPANNSGGWQWAASVGADASPYFRIFNPWSQEKFDKSGRYREMYPSSTSPPTISFTKDDHKVRTTIAKDVFKGC